MLFGDKFQDYITETVKIRQKYGELFKSMNNGKSQPLRQCHPAIPDKALHKSWSEKDTFLLHATGTDGTKSGENIFCSKRTIFTRSTAKSDAGGHIATYSKELKEINWVHKNFGNCAGLQNLIQVNTMQYKSMQCFPTVKKWMQMNPL